MRSSIPIKQNKTITKNKANKQPCYGAITSTRRDASHSWLHIRMPLVLGFPCVRWDTQQTFSPGSWGRAGRRGMLLVGGTGRRGVFLVGGYTYGLTSHPMIGTRSPAHFLKPFLMLPLLSSTLTIDCNPLTVPADAYISCHLFIILL